MRDRFLPGVPGGQIEEIYSDAPGNEIVTGKFDSPESSAALVANAFGFFLSRPGGLPPLSGCEDVEWPASSPALEKDVTRGVPEGATLFWMEVSSGPVIRFEHGIRRPSLPRVFWTPVVGVVDRNHRWHETQPLRRMMRLR